MSIDLVEDAGARWWKMQVHGTSVQCRNCLTDTGQGWFGYAP